MSALVALAPRLTDVVSTLEGFAITTFTVPVDALARLLPRELSPEVVRCDDGREVALVSAVTFRNVQLHVGFAPFIRLVACQTNFRAYVRRGDARAVHFFGTTFGSRFVVLPRYVWQLPWAYGRHETTFDFGMDGLCRKYVFRATSAHGEEHVEATGTGVKLGRLDGFTDEAATRAVLTHPLVGFVRRRSGSYATYGVDHPLLDLEVARANIARFELFTRLGLVEENAAPHSVLVMPETRFIVRLPPRGVAFTPR